MGAGNAAGLRPREVAVRRPVRRETAMVGSATLLVAISVITTGLVLGVIFSLVAAGVTIVYGSIWLPNASNGQFFLTGGPDLLEPCDLARHADLARGIAHIMHQPADQLSAWKRR